jgi:hypothetical protein
VAWRPANRSAWAVSRLRDRALVGEGGDLLAQPPAPLGDGRHAVGQQPRQDRASRQQAVGDRRPAHGGLRQGPQAPQEEGAVGGRVAGRADGADLLQIQGEVADVGLHLALGGANGGRLVAVGAGIAGPVVGDPGGGGQGGQLGVGLVPLPLQAGEHLDAGGQQGAAVVAGGQLALPVGGLAGGPLDALQGLQAALGGGAAGLAGHRHHVEGGAPLAFFLRADQGQGQGAGAADGDGGAAQVGRGEPGGPADADRPEGGILGGLGVHRPALAGGQVRGHEALAGLVAGQAFGALGEVAGQAVGVAVIPLECEGGVAPAVGVLGGGHLAVGHQQQAQHLPQGGLARLVAAPDGVQSRLERNAGEAAEVADAADGELEQGHDVRKASLGMGPTDPPTSFKNRE